MDELKAQFAKLLGREQARLFGYIHSLLQDLNDADEVFQRASLVLWKKFGDFDRERSFFSWACGVARLEVAAFLRGRARERLYFSDEVNLLLVEAQAELGDNEVEDRREALDHCIQQLRSRDRELLHTCYLETQDVNAVAQSEGRSPQSVHNSLRRIRRSLFECVRSSLALTQRPSV